MADVREREEGLFSRHGSTRALCIVALISWAPMTLYAPYLVVWLLAPEGVVPNIGAGILFVGTLLGLVFSSIAVFALWLWRKCGKCQGRLFSNARGVAAGIEGLGDKRVFESFNAPPKRDPAAAQFLGSYRSGAIVSMGLKGKLRCQWCGQEDGHSSGSALTNPR